MDAKFRLKRLKCSRRSGCSINPLEVIRPITKTVI